MGQCISLLPRDGYFSRQQQTTALPIQLLFTDSGMTAVDAGCVKVSQ